MSGLFLHSDSIACFTACFTKHSFPLLQSGQPLLGAGGGQVIKRVRVQPVPYASPALEQPVQFTHTVPAVASYKPQQQIAYAPQQPQPAYYGQPQVLQQRPKLVKQVQAAPTRALRPNIPDTEEQQEAEEYASDVSGMFMHMRTQLSLHDDLNRTV